MFTHTDGVLFDRAYYQIVEGERRRPVLEEEVDKLAKLQKVPHPRLGRTQAKELLELQERGLYEDILCSQARSYLWILARQKRLDAAVVNGLLAKAQDWGFSTEKLIFIEQ